MLALMEYKELVDLTIIDHLHAVSCCQISMHKFVLSKILHSIGYVHTHTYQGRFSQILYVRREYTEWTKKAYRKRQLWSYSA